MGSIAQKTVDNALPNLMWNLMLDTQNFSQMLVDISGDLLQSVDNKIEMQSRLDIVVTAWNMSLLSPMDRQLKFKHFIKKQKGFAPSKDALKGLKSAVKAVIKHKTDLYPNVDTELVRAEAVEQTKDNYEIKVYFKDEAEEAKQQQVEYNISRMNEEMSYRPFK